jgi:O-antigen/teichoic acid export membrane protein
MLRNGLVGKPLIKFFAEAESEEVEKVIIGSAWKQALKASLLAGMALSALSLAIYAFSPNKEFLLYSLFIFPHFVLSLPMSMANWIANAQLRFNRMMTLNVSMQLIYIGGVLWIYFTEQPLYFVFVVYLAAYLIPSLFSAFAGWAYFRQISRADKETVREFNKFGFYSMGTLVAGTLLRSSDTFIIRIFLGAEAVALYQVPQRLVNLIEVPLRALVSFFFPSLAKTNKTKGLSYFNHEFETSAGFSFLVLLPLAVGSFIFAEPLVLLLGGAGYEEAAVILRFFAIYMAITSLDRFGGIALDVLNMPQLNFKKLILMLSLNIIGDLIAVYFTDNLGWVAFVSILTFSGGIAFGFYLLRDDIPFKFKNWLVKGLKEGKRIVKKLVSK